MELQVHSFRSTIETVDLQLWTCNCGPATVDLQLLLLLQILKEGSPSAVAALQGALHLNTKYI